MAVWKSKFLPACLVKVTELYSKSLAHLGVTLRWVRHGFKIKNRKLVYFCFALSIKETKKKQGKKIYIYITIQKRVFASVFQDCNLFFLLSLRKTRGTNVPFIVIFYRPLFAWNSSLPKTMRRSRPCGSKYLLHVEKPLSVYNKR